MSGSIARAAVPLFVVKQDPAEVEAATLKAAGPVDWTRTAVVMYCEFSSERAPRMVRHLRCTPVMWLLPLHQQTT